MMYHHRTSLQRLIGSWSGNNESHKATSAPPRTGSPSPIHPIVAAETAIVVDDPAAMNFGVSLSHLKSLPIKPTDTFHAASEYVKRKTQSFDGYRSYAKLLQSDPKTSHLVREQANVFVSYAWSGGYGATMNALCEHFKDSLAETYVWMDFTILDQHVASHRDLEFENWTETFKENLSKAGKAVLVLTPGPKPIATSRSWCCFEWATIVELGIPFDLCVAKKDVNALKKELKKGLGYSNFNEIFGQINVEHAQAQKKSDQEAIYRMLKETGIVKVNSLIVHSLKNWLIFVIEESLNDQKALNNTERAFVLNARGAIHHATGEHDLATEYYRKALEITKVNPHTRLTFTTNLALVLQSKGDLVAAEKLLRDAIAHLGPTEFETRAALVNNLGMVLQGKDDLNGAEKCFTDALGLARREVGLDHLDAATYMSNLGNVYRQKKDYDRAEQMFRQSVDVRRRALGEENLSTATTISNLAVVLQAQRNLDEAEKLFQRVLDVNTKLLGKEHLSRATALNNLALVKKDMGQVEESNALGVKALLLRRKLLGPDHPLTIELQFWED